ncbi:hypothetical protein OSB04_014917 [Centaurea solstitialis]|uniref:non-specific serine/threonine protein kinase n=1 Tax=Centaurea solstitialis TaxID=347529 RepID=A0AA38TG94_9ASTR|nr:hypothetical protein OSB04_014917 [Centaurea solstitialis]
MLAATPKEEEPLFRVEDQLCRRFSLDEIRSATQNFDDSLVVGRGGFGKVYKGSIKDGPNTVVAVKISNSMSNEGALQFQAEVEMLSKIRHCNLVSLIGYSYEGKEMALVYEYMPQGTLEDHLHKDGSRLSWLQLLKICKGAARGLDYLHTGTGTQHGIIHRDVKSSNVLLDMNFAAKISDFGIAKIGPTNQTRTHVSTLVKGTFGYLDPHYVYTGNLTIKSDVYSFGVLLLEVLCGRPAVDTTLDEDQMGLAPWAQDCIKKGKLNNIIDSRLRGQISSNCLKGFARIACRCLDNKPNQRPTMAEIIGKLDVILTLQERLDSSITEGKFIDKFQWFFGAKVEPNEKESDKVNNVIVKTGKAKVDHDEKDVIETSHSEGEAIEESGKVTSTDGLSGTDRNLKPFSFNVLKMATWNFRPDLVLEEDNSGSVFKGWFDGQSLEAAKPGIGTVFAVKSLNEERHQDNKEWWAEIHYLSKLSHPNLVKLIGYCIEDDRRFLVNEFMNRGRLENHLFRRSTSFPLPWKLRLKIIAGAAKGLAYIHNQEPKMICCDIKSSSIWVDSDYNAKLSNLLWTTHEQLEPKYRHYKYKLIVDEFDAIDQDVPIRCSSPGEEIYNFGVVLLEVMTGKRNIDNNRPAHERKQVDFIRPYLDSKRGIKRIIDARIDGQYTTSVARRFAMIMKRCLSIEPRDRPTADEVVIALEELQDTQARAAPPRVRKVSDPRPVTTATTSTGANIKHFSLNNLSSHPVQETATTKAMLAATPKEEELLFRVEDQLCRRFSLDEIRSATQNFDDSLVVGRGGFGKVYKGSIKVGSNTVVVAIKISNSMSNQGALEFQAEVEMLSKIRHCNLVSLIGYSYEGKEMALVYEYMPQGTLEDHLYKDGSRLSWLQLLKICKGAARGLDYLHTGTGTQHGIIHRDVKSSNVLLDMNFAAKISDFGIAKIGPTNQTRTHVSTLVKGTFGYLDPHYVYTGNLTIKSDVYSFGVLLLEVLCGRPAVDTTLDEDQMGLAPWAQDCIKKGKLNNIIDSRLRGQISSNCLKGFARIACRCLDNKPNQRPTMAEIIGKLDVILTIQERLDSSITEGKLIDKFQWFFGAKVDSKTSNLMASRPYGSEGEPNEKESDKVDNAIVKTGQAKVDQGQKDVIGTSNSEGESSEESGCSETNRNLKPFSYNVLKMATRNFRHDTVVGEGDFGTAVFKGWFDEQSLEATKPGSGVIFTVKRLNEGRHRDDKEWLAEINHLSKLNHPNLVKLIGGSFEPLSWNQRMKIALGVAKGLAYIHNHESKMICCHITTSNILLDSDYNAKLSNLFRIKEKQLEPEYDLLWRTLEQLEPEDHQQRLIVDELDAIQHLPTGKLNIQFAHNLIFENGASFEGCSSPREEIYNFGVVLLELLTGKPNIDNNRPANERIQVDFIRPHLDTIRGIMRIIDTCIDGQYTTSVARRIAMILKRCLSIERWNRPTADEVVKALEELQDTQESAPTPRVWKVSVLRRVTSATTSTGANVQKS